MGLRSRGQTLDVDITQEIIDVFQHPPHAWQVDDSITASTQFENVFYLDLGTHALLLDTGFDFQTERHLEALEEFGCDLGKIRAIVVSHAHVDHNAGVRRARAILQVPVVAHPAAASPIERGSLPETASVIEEIDLWRFDFPACPIDYLVDDGDWLQVGEERLDVRHIPGHTPGCTAYLWRGQLFVGDALFPGGHIGWCDLRWKSSYEDVLETHERLLAHPIPALFTHPTHGPKQPFNTEYVMLLKDVAEKMLASGNNHCEGGPQVERRFPVDRDPASAGRAVRIA